LVPRPMADLVVLRARRLGARAAGGHAPGVLVVGARAGGGELGLCVLARLRGEGIAPHITLVGTAPALARRGASLSRRVLVELSRRGVVFRQGRVVADGAESVRIDDGATLAAAAALGVAGAGAPP